MKNIKWLVTLANTKPLLFLVAFLLIICSILVLVIKEQEKEIKECKFDKKVSDNYYNAKLDSLNHYYIKREAELNNEVKVTLNTIIENYKDQLAEQKSVNEKINTTINKNQRVLQDNNKTIEKLYSEETK